MMMLRRTLLLSIVCTLAACDKSNIKPTTAETASSTPTSSSPPSTSSEAMPASSKQGPVPDDPMLSNVSPMPMPPPSETKPIANASNAFAFDLWARGKNPNANATFSPASISIALAMTWLGAKADTSAQIKKTMHFEGTEDATATAWGKLSKVMTTPPRHFKLRIANRLFGEKTYAFEQPFLDKTKTAFNAPLELTDFKENFEPARKHINGWVEEQTEKRITDLLPADALDTRTRLVLVNAIYFLAKWDDPFEKNHTMDGPFEVNASSKKNVPMMHQGARYSLAQADGMKMLELPYKGGDTSMLIVLPEKKDGLAAIEKSVNAAKLEGWRKAATLQQVDVAIPRFEISPPTIPLGDDLKAMGMVLPFDKDKADFTGMAKPADPKERLYISKVFHKAFVKVDEEGTEAAAATAVVMGKGGGMPAKAIEFTADHPFLFFIIEKTSGLILFMGRVTDPSAK